MDAHLCCSSLLLRSSARVPCLAAASVTTSGAASLSLPLSSL